MASSRSALATAATTTLSLPEPTRVNPTSTSTPATATGALPPPASPSADSVHLVNSLKGTKRGSGYAYFADAEDGENGAQPDGYAIATVGMYAQWENQNRTGKRTLYFFDSCSMSEVLTNTVGFYADTNTTFWGSINSTNACVNAAVGEASNGYRSFVCYADDGRLLYKQNETDFYTIYYCQ